MNVLLLSMPDSFEHMPSLAVRMPNGALSSLAGNADPHHRVAVADLILAQDRVRSVVERLVREIEPDVVGLSVMTFQRKTAWKIIRLVRALRPEARIVVGGYDPSLAPEAYVRPCGAGADFIVRGEGDITFRELLRALESGGGFNEIRGLSYRVPGDFRHNPHRPPANLESDEIRLPNRGARVLGGYTILGRPVDVVETSRGCTFSCTFCSIIEMRGRNFHAFPLERVLEDIRDARDRGARAIFLVDDNITLDVRRFETLCRAIVEAKLNRLDYTVQAMTSSIANHGATLAPLMRRAGLRYVFLGIENVLEDDLEFLGARAKNLRRERGRRAGNATLKAIECLHRHGLYVIGGLIVGNPGDTREAVLANLEFARRFIDWPYIQHPMPYPGTPMARELRQRDLILTEDVEEYDGTTAVVQNERLPPEEVEFLRWREERWIKLRHMPAAFFHDPWFVLRNAHRMLAHTFRGCTLKSLLGWKDEREAFHRFRSLRRQERSYL